MGKITVKIGRVGVTVDFTFLLFLTVIFLMKNTAVIISFSAVCLIHELGHAAALSLAGGSISALVFSGAGIKMLPKRGELLSFKKELFVLLAGPFVNLLIFAVSSLIGKGGMFAQLNLCAAAVNLLPYKMLDGGSVIRLFAERCSHEREIFTAAGAFCALLTAAAFYAAVFVDRQLFPLFAAAVLCFVTELVTPLS